MIPRWRNKMYKDGMRMRDGQHFPSTPVGQSLYNPEK